MTFLSPLDSSPSGSIVRASLPSMFTSNRFCDVPADRRPAECPDRQGIILFLKIVPREMMVLRCELSARVCPRGEWWRASMVASG